MITINLSIISFIISKITSFKAVVLNLVLTAFVINNAFQFKKQFYPSVVYISKSNTSMAVIYFQGLLIFYLLAKLCGKIFFGAIHPTENERVLERLWFTITETCLALTLYRDDMSPKYVALFALLLFMKCFHWLAEYRVEYMERTPTISFKFHMRLWTLLGVLLMSDLYFANEALFKTINKGSPVQFILGFEYAILLTLAISAAVKYVLHTIEMHRDTFWENKSVFILYLEFFVGFSKSILYLIYFIILLSTNTVPHFAVRSVYFSVLDFLKIFRDLLQSRRAIHTMNTLYQNATLQELQAADFLCIICRENMTTAAAKKLPCNHIFHPSCLCSWFRRHQTCPTCRLNILNPTSSTQSATGGENQPTPAPTAIVQQTVPATAVSSPTIINGQESSTTNNSTFSHKEISHMCSIHNRTQFHFQQLGFQQQLSTLNDNSQQSTSKLSSINRLPFPCNMRFVGGIAIEQPRIPADLDTLSDEELRVMEENTRRGCLARLKYITNIKCMLDASAMMMNHYSSACLITGLNNNSNLKSNCSHEDTSKICNTTINDDQGATGQFSDSFSETDSSTYTSSETDSSSSSSIDD